jgi:tetratricopeptide (TPR) repeat protein
MPAAEWRDRALRGGLAVIFLLLLLVADAAFSAAQDADSSDSAALLAKARGLSDAKRFGEAAATLREALAQDPENVQARSLLARVLAWDRRFDDSIDEYRRLLEKHPESALDRAGYARALAWSGRHEESLREFRRAIAADSTNLESRVGYARAMSWTGDLAGAHAEYRRILRTDSAYGDAWLGYATVARWRGAPTAADRFLARAEARGADAEGVAEEREAVRLALRPTLGGGFTASRERQYVESGPDFVIESGGPFSIGQATLARAVGLAVRASRLTQSEESGATAPADTALNYDLRTTLVRADAAFLRGYPLQLSLGAEVRRIEPGSARVLYPVGDQDDFWGWNARFWWSAGRLTPSLGARSDYLAIKSVSGPRGILAGDVTTTDAALAWQWNGRGTANASVAKGFYSDDNERTSVGAGVAYKVRARMPRLTLDYGWTYSDWLKVSTSYFTPLQSVRHAAGAGLAGYSEAAAIDYGLRYQFALVESGNFEDIRTHTWSGYGNVIALDALPLGIEGSYSIDNNDYETWYAGVYGSVRW